MPDSFSISELAYFGCYLFLLSANMGQFDSFVDDGRKEFNKYRLLALLAYYADACYTLFDYKGMTIGSYICDILIAVFMLLMIIFSKRGRDKWLT